MFNKNLPDVKKLKRLKNYEKDCKIKQYSFFCAVNIDFVNVNDVSFETFNLNRLSFVDKTITEISNNSLNF